MPKKKDAKKAEVVEQQAITATATPYEVKKWAGLPQYCCLLCPFDTLNEDAIFDHIARLHFSQPTVVEVPGTSAEATPEEGESVLEKADGVYEIEIKENNDG